MLCEMIAVEQPVTVEQEERAAATWLLTQLCFKHRANCARVIGSSVTLGSIVRQATESESTTSRTRSSGPVWANFSSFQSAV